MIPKEGVHFFIAIKFMMIDVNGHLKLRRNCFKQIQGAENNLQNLVLQRVSNPAHTTHINLQLS